ncbi:hypothetical protein SCLCIDRAFT_21312 [Scleroderma citrinum Foug A]|uniref:Uncharacterized protein n=1 Tax=Scleroderma citrinum Foug A TaxID=1036808 RepID=A0A0C3EHK9_9AGAM|nr:hypothetical protein SCLCIDRAFT_21312 [Scleroderma citrinum Foug A]
MDKVIEKVSKKFVVLKEYKDCWPAYDYIQAHLKYLSSQSKTKEKGKTSASVQKR